MSPASPDIPEYEKQRRAIMARNQEKMKELGLQHLAAEIMPKQQPKPRTQAKGLASKKKKVSRALCSIPIGQGKLYLCAITHASAQCFWL